MGERGKNHIERQGAAFTLFWIGDNLCLLQRMGERGRNHIERQGAVFTLTGHLLFVTHHSTITSLGRVSFFDKTIIISNGFSSDVSLL